MPGRGGATLFEDLPEEIIDKILIRLPSKDVGRCRVVSTSWRGATSTPQFMLKHHRRQPSLPIIDGNSRPTGLSVLGAGACTQQLWPFLRGDKNSSMNGLCASCDGFLIVSQGSRLYICNPVTRKHALLRRWPQCRPAGIYYSVIGFYRQHSTGEYKVLWVSHPACWAQSKSSLYVLTVGSGKPRQVRVRTPTVLSPSTEQKLLKELCPNFFSPPPVHHCGSLHWCRYDATDITEGGGDIIVFNTETESFRWMRSPAQLCSNRKLFNMKGALAFWGLTPGFMTINVWVMQDYEAEIWDFKYQIDLSTLEASRQLYLTSFEKKKKKKTPLDSAVEFFNDMAVLNDRELLIMFNKKHVLRCDIDGNFLGIVKIGNSQYCMELTQHRLQESIIPIPSHEMQGEDEESPFSTGLL